MCGDSFLLHLQCQFLFRSDLIMNKKVTQKRGRAKSKAKKKTNKERQNRRPGKAQNNKQQRKPNKRRNSLECITVRVYGEYDCKRCNVRWSSPRTWQMQSPSGKVQQLYSQECEYCGDEVFAYYVHDLCRSCQDWPCRCEIRVYGWYRCQKCSKIWESAYAYQEKGTGYQLYGQECKRCGANNYPYRTEPLLKPDNDEERHTDMNKNHIQELCGKCKNKKHPCSWQY